MGSRRRAYDRQLIARGARLAYRVAEEVPFCWLCPAESGRRAKEHIFALSLQRALKAEEEQFTPTHVDSLGRVVSARQTIPAKALLAGEVCEGCNSGWMSRLEAEAAPLLLTRVRCEARRSLGEQEQLTLARWFFKTAIVLNSSQNYRLLLPKDVRHSARIGLHPDVRVFVARRPLNPQDRLSFRQGYSGMFSVTPK